MQHYDRPNVPVAAGLRSRRLIILLASPCNRAAHDLHPQSLSAARTAGIPGTGAASEWATASPPPVFNSRFCRSLPREPYWNVKQRARCADAPVDCRAKIRAHRDAAQQSGRLHHRVLRSSTGFCLIWHIWWLVVLGLVCAYISFVVFAWRDEGEFEISAEEVA